MLPTIIQNETLSIANTRGITLQSIVWSLRVSHLWHCKYKKMYLCPILARHCLFSHCIWFTHLKIIKSYSTVRVKERSSYFANNNNLVHLTRLLVMHALPINIYKTLTSVLSRRRGRNRRGAWQTAKKGAGLAAPERASTFIRTMYVKTSKRRFWMHPYFPSNTKHNLCCKINTKPSKHLQERWSALKCLTEWGEACQ